MWTFEQQTGDLRYEGKVVASGYSGHEAGKNNPKMQHVPCIGPIPEGYYTIASPIDTASHGPYVLHLTPFQHNQMFGRSGFLIHGDSVKQPGTASEGCVILGRMVREAIWQSGDRTLRVVSAQKNSNPVPDLDGEICV
jgi:hypothetical protein